MARTQLLADLLRHLRVARSCERQRASTSEGLEREAEAAQRRLRRRELLGGAGALAGSALLGRGVAACSSDERPRGDATGQARGLVSGAASQPRVAIVGAGIAGLVCADRLQKQGIVASVYEANTRVGGRCHSNREFPGHVGENGGEMIDTAHKTILGYASELKLALEDYTKQPGEPVYYFQGARRSSAEVVDQWRALVPRIRADLQGLSAAPSARAHTAADVALDETSLQAWLDTRCADLPLLKAMLSAAYISEYGREPAEQSCLNLLEFVRADRRSVFEPYGSSDERYHIVGGNDQIPALLRARLRAPVVTGATLTGLARSATGEFVLTFRETTQVTVADVVVLAIPFSVLRRVTLDASLGLPPEKVRAIQELGYGYNGKTEYLFQGRPWSAQGSDGDVYADLANLQNTWESNWTGGDGSSTILTDYFGGNLGYARQMLRPAGTGTGGVSCGSCHGPGASFHPARYDLILPQADAFLADLDRVFPGASAQVVRRTSGAPVMHRAHWLPQSFSRGSYTCYLPGQFTSIAGWEGTPVGDLHFAGEHADSFYEWQGYLEGAARSGVAVAQAIVGSHAGGNR